MVTLLSKLSKDRGITLFELMIASLMVSMVFLGSTSVYLSAVKFTSNMTTSSKALSPIVSLEDIVRNVNLANFFTISNGGKTLELRGDYAQANSWSGLVSLNTPGVAAGDAIIRYDICGTNDIRLSTSTVGGPVLTGCASPTILLANVDSAASSFTALNPSAGISNVVQIHVVTTLNPVSTVETAASLSAQARA